MRGCGVTQLDVGATVGLILSDDITLRGVREVFEFSACACRSYVVDFLGRCMMLLQENVVQISFCF